MVELEAEVFALLEEMGHKFFMPAVRTLAFVIRKGLRHISKGIYVNKEGVDMVHGSQKSVMLHSALPRCCATLWPYGCRNCH